MNFSLSEEKGRLAVMARREMTPEITRRERRLQRQMAEREQKQRQSELSREGQTEMAAIRQTKEELERLYLILENVVEEKLVDSIIYQIKSAEARYDYHYIKLRQLEQQLQAG